MLGRLSNCLIYINLFNPCNNPLDDICRNEEPESLPVKQRAPSMWLLNGGSKFQTQAVYLQS